MTASRGKLVELSHILESGLASHPNLPPLEITDYLSRIDSRKYYDPGTEFHIARLDLVSSTGTYLDAPFHRFAQGSDLAGLALVALVDLEGEVVRPDLSRSRAIDQSWFEGRSLENRAVLIHTGWSAHWGTSQYFRDHPHLTRPAAEYLKNAGAALVGLDSLNIDDTNDGARPVHTILLAAGIPIVENMANLDLLPEKGFVFFAAPPRIKGCGSFPVRAFALVS